MSKWDKFSQANKKGSEETTPYPTMNLRQVVKSNGTIQIEQLIEHRNINNVVVHTEWATIPTIYEES